MASVYAVCEISSNVICPASWLICADFLTCLAMKIYECLRQKVKSNCWCQLACGGGKLLCDNACNPFIRWAIAVNTERYRLLPADGWPNCINPIWTYLPHINQLSGLCCPEETTAKLVHCDSFSPVTAVTMPFFSSTREKEGPIYTVIPSSMRPKGGKPSLIAPWTDSYYTRGHRAAQHSSAPRPIHTRMTCCATHV